MNLTGGKTRDGGNVVGASVFYSNPPIEEAKGDDESEEVKKLNKELKVSLRFCFFSLNIIVHISCKIGLYSVGTSRKNS